MIERKEITSNASTEGEASTSPKDMYIERGRKIGSGGFSTVYEIVMHPMSVASEFLIGARVGTKIPFGVGSKMGALKYVIPSQFSGLESQVESYIMRYVKHPGINRALCIQIEASGTTHIYQNLATGDASTLIRRSFNKVSDKTIKRWFFQIACAVAKMHSCGICHCDIKSGNLLLFQTDPEAKEIPKLGAFQVCDAFDTCDIQLNDFSLSRLIPNYEQGTKDVCGCTSYTATHRPMEVWRENSFSFSADVWALACAFYQIKYGNILFPDRKGMEKPNLLETTFRREFAIQDIEAWCKFAHAPRIPRPRSEILEDLDNMVDRDELFASSKHVSKGLPVAKEVGGLPISKCLAIPIKKQSTEHREKPISHSAPNPQILRDFPSKGTKFEPPKDWFEEGNRDFNNLILSMLNVDQNNRLTIWDVLEDEYFDDIRDSPAVERYKIPAEECQYTNINFLIAGASQQIIDECKVCTSDQNVIELAISLYQRCREDSKILVKTLPCIRTCVIVAHKILYRCPPKNFAMGGCLREEIQLSQILNYKLLP